MVDTAIGTARVHLAAILTGIGINVRKSPSVGHISPPAAIIVPAPDWIIPNTQLGGKKIQARIALRIILITGKTAAAASLEDLEELTEKVLLETAGGQWIIGNVAGPGALTIAGTDYLSATITLTQAIVIVAP